MARDSYALLHLPMISGIVLFALGVKKVVEHTGDPLKDMPAVALCGGVALYFAAHVGFRLRNVGSVGGRGSSLPPCVSRSYPWRCEPPASRSWP